MRLRGVREVWRTLGRSRVFDGLLASGVCATDVTAALALFPAGDPDRIPAVAISAVGAAPLLVRRRHPIAVALTTLALDLLHTLLGLGDPAILPSTIGLYGLGRYAAGGPAWGISAGTVVMYALLSLATAPGPLYYSAVPVLLPLVFTGAGAFFRLRGELRERRRQQVAESAVRAERRRIARELHDVVAHHITTINVLVGAGRTTMAADPERAQEVLVTAERTARAAMTEMRQLLHVLRAEDDGEPEDHSGTGAAALPALVEQVRGTGLPVGMEVTGQTAPLPAAVDHAVYRIVQEALTNTRKHAPGARVSVRLAYLPGAVEVEVLDDGLGRRPGGQQGGGFGLGGMAERVALCGGRLQTGPRPSGGFQVHARIPVPEPREPAVRISAPWSREASKENL
ncbi:sensor histidine kinase [Planomonospora sp. ID82291]|uniref:sensor histidine kinase n=1 Tax=Planomonospora sp. ID82291 TaxID=2738136 RepID=UPI0018C3D858|nr:histidine kinase [Planomonospora sp. ID82291]MBG0813982.1 sensor histidine kinase [Planomonospora sp. ID82291]